MGGLRSGLLIDINSVGYIIALQNRNKENDMTTATQRLFARIEARYDNVDFAAHYTIGALKGYMEILAEKFPEVEQHISQMEDFMEGNQ